MGDFTVAHQKYFPLFVRNQEDEVNVLVSSVCLFREIVGACVN